LIKLKEIDAVRKKVPMNSMMKGASSFASLLEMTIVCLDYWDLAGWGCGEGNEL